MSWKPIIIGADTSPEAAAAVTFGCRLAQAAETTCHVVHATPDPWMAIASASLPPDLTEYRQALADRARQEILLATRGIGVPEQAHEVIVRMGRPVRALRDVVKELGAELVVLGGKHHSVLERWLGGSTALDAVRALPVPVLVTREPPRRIRRVLAAADFSAAAHSTLAAAERLAETFDAELRVVSVFEPLPAVPGMGSVESPEYYALWEEMLRRDVWPLVRRAHTETVVRHGRVVETLRREAATWPADLLVMGSHGKGWVDRLLLGSVTERLLNELPTSVVVVPTAAALAAHPSPEVARALHSVA